MKRLLKKFKNINRSYRTTRDAVMACPLAFAEVGVKGRVRSVLNYKKPAFWGILLALLVCVVMAVGFLTDPKDDIIPEDIYAIGNDGVVTLAEYEKKYQDLLDEAYSEEEATKLAQLKCLENEATYQEALRKGFDVSKKEIDEYIAGVKESVKVASNGEEKLKEKISKYGSEEAYYDYLEIACKKSLPINKYLTDLKEQWLYDLDSEFETFEEYQNVVVGNLVIAEEFMLANGEAIDYVIEELSADETKADNQGNEKYAAVYKEKISPGDYETIISLCQDTFSEYVDAIRKEELPELSSYIEYDLLKKWIEYRTTDFHYGYSSSEEYQIFVDQVEVYDNYALLRGNTGDVEENRKEGINYFLIQNFDGKLRIVDWYWEAKDTNDVVLRGEFKYSPAYWTKVAEAKSEIRAGERFKITNKELNLGEELALTDEIVIYVLFCNEWSEGQAFSDSDCDFVIDVYDNKILYNSDEGVFVDVKNNKSLYLSEDQRNYFNSLLKDYCLMANEKQEIDCRV